MARQSRAFHLTIAIMLSVLLFTGAAELTLGAAEGARGAEEGAQSAREPELIAAVRNRDIETVRTMLSTPVDVNAPQPDGATGLHWAAYGGDLDIAALLVGAGAAVNRANEYGITPLMVACDNGNGSIVAMLLEAGAGANTMLPTGQTALMACTRAGSLEGVRALLASGADPNVSEPRRGQTALMWAVSRTHVAVARTLIESGADIHARSDGGFTPMLFAARVGDVESVRLLMSAGIDQTQSRASDGMTPLSMAAASGHEALSIFLVENGADPDASEGGAAPLHYAVMEGISYMRFRPAMPELVKTLLEHGADPNAQLVRSVVDGFRGNLAGATPLVIAATAANVEMMRTLLAAGANPQLPTRANVTPLMAAAGMLRREGFSEDKEANALEALDLMVELGGEVTTVDVDGRTALHMATHLAADRIVRFLGDHGAVVDARDKYQQTPLSAAMGIRLPWVPKNEELGEEGFVKTTTVQLLLGQGATPVDTPGYFTPVDPDTDVTRFNPNQAIVPGLDPSR